MLRRLPYGVRYIVAVTAWVGVVAGDAFARVALLAMLPFVWIRSAFGMAHTQETAQLQANYVDFYTRPLMRMPKADWKRLLGRRCRSAEGPATSSEEPSEPRFLKNVGNDRA